MKKLISKIKWSFLGMLLPMAVLAITLEEAGLTKPSTVPQSTLQEIINGIINTAMGLVGLLSLIALIIGAFLLITSGGDEEKTKSGKGYITYGIIGLIVAVSAYAILQFVIGGLGGKTGSSTNTDSGTKSLPTCKDEAEYWGGGMHPVSAILTATVRD